MSASEVTFVDELPLIATSARTREPRYDALTERPGEWAEWWGEVPSYIHKAAQTARRPGFRFEGAIRNGKAYIRAVSEGSSA